MSRLPVSSFTPTPSPSNIPLAIFTVLSIQVSGSKSTGSCPAAVYILIAPMTPAATWEATSASVVAMFREVFSVLFPLFRLKCQPLTFPNAQISAFSSNDGVNMSSAKAALVSAASSTTPLPAPTVDRRGLEFVAAPPLKCGVSCSRSCRCLYPGCARPSSVFWHAVGCSLNSL